MVTWGMRLERVLPYAMTVATVEGDVLGKLVYLAHRARPRGVLLALTWPFHALGGGPFLTGRGGSGRVWVGRNPLQSLDIRLSAV
jgi:hypothetical protein